VSAAREANDREHPSKDEGLAAKVLNQRVEELIKQYGLDHGTTTRPRDRFDIEEDSGLAPLRAAYAHGAEGSLATPRSHQFATQFFGPSAPKGLYEPQQLSGSDRFVYWKTIEEPPYVPKFEDVKARVETRWKLDKARAMARAEADRIADLARKAKGDPEKNLQDASTQFGNVIRLDHVARLVSRPQAVVSGMAQKSFEPYQVPEYAVAYPSEDLVDKLLSMKEKGDVSVLHDRPEEHYYVAALTYRAPPPEMTFIAEAARPDALMTRLEQDSQARRKYREAALEQLRAEARLSYDEENLKAMRGSGGPTEEE
jgi:hypothetical protein